MHHSTGLARNPFVRTHKIAINNNNKFLIYYELWIDGSFVRSVRLISVCVCVCVCVPTKIGDVKVMFIDAALSCRLLSNKRLLFLCSCLALLSSCVRWIVRVLDDWCASWAWFCISYIPHASMCGARTQDAHAVTTKDLSSLVDSTSSS